MIDELRLLIFEVSKRHLLLSPSTIQNPKFIIQNPISSSSSHGLPSQITRRSKNPPAGPMLFSRD
jgi:hypothetical protein